MVLSRAGRIAAFNHVLDVVLNRGDGSPLKSSLIASNVTSIDDLVAIRGGQIEHLSFSEPDGGIKIDLFRGDKNLLATFLDFYRSRVDLDDLLTNSNILASVKHRSTLEPDSFDAAQVRSILKKLGRPTGSATGARTDKNELKAFFEFIRADIRLMRYYFQKQSLIEIAVHFGLKVQLETTEKKNVASININN